MRLVAERIRWVGATLLVALTLALAGCSTTPQESVSGESLAPSPPPVASGAATTAPTAAAPSAAPLPIFEKLSGTAWIGEGPEGWLAGELGEAYRRLPDDEVGILAKDNWILSIRYPKEEGLGITLLVRRNSSVEPLEVRLGDLLPSSIAIAKDIAFVSGIPFATGKDLPVFRILLPDPAGRPDPLIQPDPGDRVRNLAISADGSTLASSICAVNAEEFTLDQCVLELLPTTEGGEAQPVTELPGLLGLISPEIAIVVDPVGDTEPGWVAGFDLKSGERLWQVDGQIERWRIDVVRGELVIARFEPGESPRFVIEAVALGNGKVTTLYEESTTTPPTFWTDQSTDDFLVLSTVSDIATAAAESPDGLVPVLIIDRTTRSVDPWLLSIGKAS